MDRHADRAAALSGLLARWGAAAPRPATEVFGALAAAPLPAEAGAADALEGAPGLPLEGAPGLGLARLAPLPDLVPLPGDADRAPVGHPLGEPGWRSRPIRSPSGDAGRAISTGFSALDALFEAGGLPRAGLVVLRGTGSIGATTVALRTVAQAQSGGALVAWVDLARSLDPVEAVARGVRLEWLAVLAPSALDEALAMSGSLLQGRAVDVLVLDLAVGVRASASPTRDPAPARLPGAHDRLDVRHARPARRPPPLADRVARLVTFARRAGVLLLVLEPAEAPSPVRAALAEGSSVRLELRRTDWVRLGREVVGQRTEVRVAKDRHGAPDRRTTLRLLYAEGGPRDRCLARDELLAEEPVAAGTAGITRAAGARTATAVPTGHLPAAPATSTSCQEPDRPTDAPPPPRLAPPRAPARPGARSLDPRHRPADPRRAAVG